MLNYTASIAGDAERTAQHLSQRTLQATVKGERSGALPKFYFLY